MSNLLLQHLRLREFRNYSSLDLELDAGFHVVEGANAQGKTNLLEAVYLLASTRMLRGVRDHEAIRAGESRAAVTGQTESTTLSVVLEVGVRKRAFLNGVALPRAADLIGRLPCVCVSTADLPIVRGEPSDRRFFLDLELSQASSGYLRHFTHYKRALEQRNALLKFANDRFVSADSFEPWEQQLAHHGSAMRVARMEFVRSLGHHAGEIYGTLGHGESFAVTYVAADGVEPSNESDLLASLIERRTQDLQRRSTSVGPHRDELRIEVEGREARLFASQGQQRSALLALKLATLLLLADQLGETPLLLLDDILSDLDEKRRAKLATWILDHARQALLTCTESQSVGAEILARARVLTVSEGYIQDR